MRLAGLDRSRPSKIADIGCGTDAPAYLALHQSGELGRRILAAQQLLRPCRLCPRTCNVDRLAGEPGFCGVASLAVVAAWQPHFGEEACLVGDNGSGTIFFAGCNLACVFCQNSDISRPATARAAGHEATPEELAGIMLALQEQGCANINLVSPTHVVPQVLAALDIACARGLRLPLVYNSGGYDSLETLGLLDNVVDIYMPDAKVWEPEIAARLLGARDYPETARAALLEMHRQTGDLFLNEQGLAVRGLLLRHLVLPDNLAGSEHWLRFIAETVSRNTFIHIMEQYRPCAEAEDHAGLNRPVSAQECEKARRIARDFGLQPLEERFPHGLFRLLKGL
ncbi:MAG: radical SAM protein [Desulfovibrionaceae bacterium]